MDAVKVGYLAAQRKHSASVCEMCDSNHMRIRRTADFCLAVS